MFLIVSMALNQTFVSGHAKVVALALGDFYQTFGGVVVIDGIAVLAVGAKYGGHAADDDVSVIRRDALFLFLYNLSHCFVFLVVANIAVIFLIPNIFCRFFRGLRHDFPRSIIDLSIRYRIHL
jgi:hypothetical protein